jgi:aspartokinase-like uncharacterized kinase
MSDLIVAKVGGSLFDLPDLGERLRTWLAALGNRRVLLVPGGGRGADVIRELDAIHRLGEERAHWLALRVLTVNAEFLATLLQVPVVAAPAETGGVAVLDAHAFCRMDEGRHGALPHLWRVTSDSIAARVAAIGGGSLVLLKSTDLPSDMNWSRAAAAGLVDEFFAEIAAANAVDIGWVNLRQAGSPPESPVAFRYRPLRREG